MKDPYLQMTLAAGSGRVMNLHRTTRGLAARGEEGKRFFDVSALNNVYLIKDVDTRAGVLNRDRLRVRTRIYLPFDPAAVFEGGQMIDVGGTGYRQTLEGFADMKVPERRAALENDISMLGVIDQLPSLAPFLVRDRLERAGFPVDDRYVQVSVDEWDEISLFIRAQFQKIIEAVFGARAGTGGKVDQLLQKLWDLSDKPALEELARAFRLPAEGCEATFYAWKGVIYFTYEYGTYAERIRRFVHWLQNDATVPAHTAAPLPAECARLRQVILDRIGADLVQINQRLTAYSSAFNDLFQQGKGAASFLDFLARASEHFNVLGIAIGRVQHTTLVWDKFTGRLSGRAPRPEMLVELLAALAQILGEPTGNKAIAATLAPR